MNPAVFPGYSMLTSFGQAAPLNLEFQRAGRVLPIPFHFLDTKYMNVRPKNYSWLEFYDHLIDLEKHTFSKRAIVKRLMVTRGTTPRWMNFMRSMSSEGLGRIKFFTNVRRALETDEQVRRYFEQETADLPRVYEDQIREDLGPLFAWLPPGALNHDPYAYIRSVELEV
jgi:hypothetical protein